MERKIGEIFEYKGEWYQCVNTGFSCADCDIKGDCSNEHIGACSGILRTDEKAVRFKKLEKVGEPFPCNYYGDDRLIIMQEYRVYENRIISTEGVQMYITDEKHKRVAIATKQNQEDMEEKKLNLKEFDLEKAKAGKPVCTRDGRKARIIAFDRRLFYKNVSYPILALVERSDGEDDVCGYNEKGKVLIEDGAEYKDDLMMLPEKKEGWVNVYKRENEYICENECNVSTGIAVYKSEGEAKRNIDKNEIYVNTIKITWEE